MMLKASLLAWLALMFNLKSFPWLSYRCRSI